MWVVESRLMEITKTLTTLRMEKKITKTHHTYIKNGDNTYTLTTADGIVYEFNTSGKLVQIKDVDLNTISFTYTDGDLTSITDTIGRTVSLTYSNDRLWKISYDSAEIEYSYDENGCLVWMDDFLNRRTNYEYNSGYNNWLLSKIEYIIDGYTTYSYNRFTDSDYYKYYITDQRVYETNQVRHIALSYVEEGSEQYLFTGKEIVQLISTTTVPVTMTVRLAGS